MPSSIIRSSARDVCYNAVLMQEHTYEILNRVELTHWWFRGRRAILRSFLQRISDAMRKEGAESLKILDVGCGTGGNLPMLSEFGSASGVDVSEEALAYARSRGLNVTHTSADRLPQADGTMDLVAALDVVEHLDDDIAGLREMRRVLRPGGRLLVMVPAFMWLWGVQDDVSEHRIRYTRPQIIDRLQTAGLTVDRACYANFTFFFPILLGRLVMRVFKLKPASENNVNVSILNGLFATIFGAERYWLRWFGFPVGVSIIVVARR